MNIHRTILGAGIAMALCAFGCQDEKKPESKEESKPTAAAQPTPAPTTAPTPTATATAADTAAAAAADTTPLPAPPADKVETEGKPPSPHHLWVHGFWHWGGKEYVWHPGYWDDETAVVTSAPPALRVERPGMAPGANYFWAPGYWHWVAKEYVWAPGHWSVNRTGYAYVHPTYVEEKGKWVRKGFGWEKEADVKKRYAATLEKHGEVMVIKTETTEFVKRGEREGWMKAAAHH